MKVLSLSILFLCSLQLLRGQDTELVNAAALQSGSFMVATPRSYSGPNLMTGSVGDYTPEALFDLSRKMWCSENGAPFPYVFVLELTEPYMIQELAFNNICEDYTGISTKEVRVEFATDLKNPVYRSVETWTLPEGKESRFPIAPAECRLIRLTILSNYGHDKYTELAEFGAFGTPVMPDIRPVNVGGEWQTNWGPLEFVQAGTSVSGKYEYHGGEILYGGINRNQISYKWVEKGYEQEGWTILFMNREGTRLTGVWCHGNAWTDYGFWIMERGEGKPFVPVIAGEEPGAGLAGFRHEVSEDVVNKMEETLNRDDRLVLYGINFETNSAAITDESFNVLDHLARLLENRSDLRIRVEGHTDDVGTETSNQKLSQDRATAVRDYLVKSHGVDAGRVAVEGKGESVPIAENETEAGKAANRRVEIHRQK